MFFKIKSKEAKFWEWFQQNEAMLFDWQKDQKKVFSELNAQLLKVNPGLVFEFGPIQDGRLELVLSADGIKAVIPAVKKLTDTAPELKKWRVTAFRPRTGALKITFGDRSISPEDVFFQISDKQPDGRIDLNFLIKGFSKQDESFYWNSLFLMLDSVLGEYDVMTKVGKIKLVEYVENENEYIPIEKITDKL